jgi:saccharopine dehydrogenase-like NADP-dependent oxidoreductase
MADAGVQEVGLCDAVPAQLDAAMASLAGRPGAAKLRPVHLDLTDRAGATSLLRGQDVAVDALPARASPLAIHAALEAGTPLVTCRRAAPPASPISRRRLTDAAD